MARDNRWMGTAPAVACVRTATPSNVEIGDIFTLTITAPSGESQSISYTATAATVANVTAGLTDVWNSSTQSLISAVTATDDTTHVTLTADVAGEDFILSKSTTNGSSNDTQDITLAEVTPSSGPKHYDTAANWSAGEVPGEVADETVYIEDFSGDILYGLDQSGAAHVLAAFKISQTMTGKIGSNGIAGKAGDYLQIRTAKLEIGYQNGPGTAQGSGRIKIDTGTDACDIVIHNSGSGSDTGKPAVRLLTNSGGSAEASNLEVKKGKVGLAFEAGETSTINNVLVGYVSNVASDSDVFIGEGVTVSAVSSNGGDIVQRCGSTLNEISAGTLRIEGDGAISTLNVSGGVVTSNSSGTITNLNVSGNSIVDFTKSKTSRTVTNPKLSSGGTIKYNKAHITFTNPVESITGGDEVDYKLSTV